MLEKEGIESHVVDLTMRSVFARLRPRDISLDDGEALLRTFMAYKRGEPCACAIVRAPSPEERLVDEFAASARHTSPNA
ncbi:hypothetical protein ORS3428_29635 [Mesorhizobium sp. ORS 3428]|nr:hypothetical protein ORS3428_29635 [Mesorhizobium sp. ORS 3428]